MVVIDKIILITIVCSNKELCADCEEALLLNHLNRTCIVDNLNLLCVTEEPVSSVARHWERGSPIPELAINEAPGETLFLSKYKKQGKSKCLDVTLSPWLLYLQEK